jgi:hypothetical protein
VSITPAGWYPDPRGISTHRWWDGTQWTEHVPQPYDLAQSLEAPSDAKPYTPYIWLVALLPLLSYIGLALFDWAGYFRASMSLDLDLLASVGIQYAILIGVSWVVGAACWLFAYLDWRQLKQREIPRPFHFAWVFLAPGVYSIGRSVIVRRRTGVGIAPMWVTIAVLVFGLVLSFVVVIAATLSAVSELSTSYPLYG